MSILGIDPGPTETALVWWNENTVLEARKVPSDQVCGLIVNSCEVVACEHLQCFGMAVGKEVFETAYWIGEFRRVCHVSQIPFYRIFRTEEKMCLCNSTRAKDANIRQALIDRFGVVGTKKNRGPLYGISGDMWSALAVAVTYQAKYGTAAPQAQPELIPSEGALL